jgi:hypothetical protein
MDSADKRRVEQLCESTVSAVSTLDGGMIGTVDRVQLSPGLSVVVKTGEPTPVEDIVLSQEHFEAALADLTREDDNLDGGDDQLG